VGASGGFERGRERQVVCWAAVYPSSPHSKPLRQSTPTLTSGNAIDVKGAEALAEALAANNTLSRICFNDNYLGSGGAKALAEALRSNTAIRELQLRGNELGDEGLAAIAEALMVRRGRGRGGCRLLRCRCCPGLWKKSEAGSVETRERHHPADATPPQSQPSHRPPPHPPHRQARDAPIEVLDVGNNSLSAASADVLARLMHQKAASIKDINLYMNELGNSGIATLAPAIAACK
jgi:hypothetical protein